ncbi:multicopper oxidase family protein [Actinoplanes subtropicus]|uniref:multicopper oxidase family protein n=1 Tax=Actinoplanes subtropicus TaxID=543632 RepID=UPI0004C2C3D5|nr:multicopper oxidase family protein [Actinoplanes subtropicus]
MSTASVLVIDLLIAVLAAAGWLAGGAAAATGHRRAALGLGLAALVATLARAVTVVALARAGWWFAAEKVVIAGPLSLAAIVVAVARRTPAALLFAGYATTAGLLVTVLHGYPVTPGVALLAVAGVAVATGITRRSRPTLVVAALALVAATGFAIRPAPTVHHHSYSAAEVGTPTKRFTLTAATTTVEVDGHDVAAWAFNGQVPGPALVATVGDVLEVTLRNQDIGQGVTLHWHGYDVPNAMDGVPGVTQAAVLPGQEFVYRFRADRPGTYWYHTHEASDEGVRMGLYGTLVVHPAPVTGLDVTVPVHTLSGRPLPTFSQASAVAGTPVRLRLINTDNTTHRYALAETAFLVAAIDGRDLQGPTPLSRTAVLVPAGGRYDLTFTAPAGPVGLFVDGRPVWATGHVAAPPSGWPALDPLIYGTPAPAPWSGYDKSFTLVLDRGLDLHGLLPRYAHTVNGAADPDIPPEIVHLGDRVKFTIVNRSAVVHPWHLHGHHVLVLSRNGKPSTGSPLWLDSFDVRPGDVWEVTFLADNPGMWANHCHNLSHAAAGMMLHLMYE